MQQEMTYGSDYHYLPLTSIHSGQGEEVAPGVFSQTIQIVNICFVENRDEGGWALVDAGMPNSADAIITAAKERFGERPPQAILLTHGHFDHVGAIIELVRHWRVPVYAHEAELPFLTGRQAYLPPDPAVEGGMVAKLSFWYPNEPIHLGSHVGSLPADHSVPFLPEWRWLHTPGHTPGHISLFRESDRTLIVGDAFTTVKQESLVKVFTQEREINGPPKYFTTDWPSAHESVAKLEALKPRAAITGHGLPMKGSELAESLERLARNFGRQAVPAHGRYVPH
ncbi:MBL fold metallo-hydrolase [Cohnella lubricantis]|uniref:MBL fold metallo-hydrolase n=1 Tax=Cohnella lubricantis TaxID=2163172 RepID=A0A841TCH1_9BACL|nr:MBL fold metallo-hydrolase [Cohnella lubricantis]MBB6677856.1 MBL fold metallo-hydrolase [Cohnella lubricantis]MBP2119035.1 glyoxylase-like metal-dependent hydrolase (beta-lactamase superfamily II) [Cohnella lubricantis]